MTHYTRSNGSQVPIADMAYSHLKSALAKLAFEQPERTDEIAAMRDDLARRDDAFAKEQAQ